MYISVLFHICLSYSIHFIGLSHVICPPSYLWLVWPCRIYFCDMRSCVTFYKIHRIWVFTPTTSIREFWRDCRKWSTWSRNLSSLFRFISDIKIDIMRIWTIWSLCIHMCIIINITIPQTLCLFTLCI